MADDAPFLGFDIGGTKCAAVVGTAAGEIVDRTTWPSEATRGPDAMIADFIAHGRRLLQAHPDIRRIGVAIGGPLDSRAGVILSPPNLPAWDAVPLKQRLEEALSLPVNVEHDAAACCLAEYRWGAGHVDECRTMAYLTCGTGFGVGFIFDGRLHRGAGGRSPEIGHVRLAPRGPVAFGKAGSAEAFCAGTGIGRIAAWRHRRRWADPPPSEEISRLARSGDADAQDVLAFHANCVGQVCAALADTLFPDAIVLGSLALHLGEPWVRAVQRTFAREALPDALALCRLRPAQLGARLQDLSALVAAIGD